MQCLQAAKHCIWGPPDIISISVSVSILKWSANNGLADEVLLTWNQLPGSSWQHSSAQLVPADTTKAYESVHDGKRCLQGLRCRSEFASFRKPACTSRARGAFGKRSRQRSLSCER